MCYTPDSPLLGAPQATAAQCAGYLCSRPHGAYTEYDIAQVIVPSYFSMSAPVGIDPVLLLAQLVHETGNLTSWWSQRPRRNPAGIGVTGRRRLRKPTAGSWVKRGVWWVEGVSFATWEDDAITAHSGRMLAYALRDDQATRTQLTLIRCALTYRPLDRYRGEAPTLRGLEGRWAVPGHGYADALATIAGAMARWV